MKNIKEIMSYVVIILVVILIRTFIVTPVRVDGDSMNPTLKDGEILVNNNETSIIVNNVTAQEYWNENNVFMFKENVYLCARFKEIA